MHRQHVTYMCMNIYSCACAQVHMCMHMCINAHAHVRARVRRSINLFHRHIHVHQCMHMCINAHAHVRVRRSIDLFHLTWLQFSHSPTAHTVVLHSQKSRRQRTCMGRSHHMHMPPPIYHYDAIYICVYVCVDAWEARIQVIRTFT